MLVLLAACVVKRTFVSYSLLLLDVAAVLMNVSYGEVQLSERVRSNNRVFITFWGASN